jgi:hypothetical protein
MRRHSKGSDAFAAPDVAHQLALAARSTLHSLIKPVISVASLAIRDCIPPHASATAGDAREEPADG